MKKALCLFILIFTLFVSQAQEIYSGLASDAYILKFKNEEKLKQGKHSSLKKLRKVHIQIKNEGKTVYINGKEYQKKGLHYIESTDKIYGLNDYHNHSWNKEENWHLSYEIDNSDFYLILIEKADEKFIQSVYSLGHRNHFFTLIKKNAITHK